MTIRTAPCDWPINYGQCPRVEAWENLPASGKEVYEHMATEYLWRWTGRSLGLCEVTIRPCRADCDGRSTFYGDGPYPHNGGSGPWPVLISGEWFNLRCGGCGGDSCSCGHVSSLALPGPVDSIVGVTLDGEVLPPEAYRVDNHRWLTRTDGGSWPTCQNLSVGADEPGGWAVTYMRGAPVPVGGQVAAGVLAVELFKAACNDSTCALPQRVQTVTRQGVTIAMLDAFDDVEKGHTGIWLIDSWLASVTKSPPCSRVLSPDTRTPRRTTSQGNVGGLGFGSGGFGA